MGCVLRGRSKALGVEGHLREVSCHVTCPNAWNQVSNHEDMT